MLSTVKATNYADTSSYCVLQVLYKGVSRFPYTSSDINYIKYKVKIV